MRTALFVALLLLCSSPAQAVTITLLRPLSSSPQVTEALFRLQGELLAVGLEVDIARRPPDLGSDAIAMNDWFDQMATERAMDAIIDVVGDPIPVGADVWIFQQSSRSFRASRVVLEPNTQNAPETLAIRTIEVLRANFLVIDLARKDQRQSARVEPAREQPSEGPEAVGRLGLAAGGSLLTSLDGVGPAILPLLRLDWQLPAGLATTAAVSGFGTRPTVETAAGKVSVAQDYGLLGLSYWAPSESVLQAFVSLASGAMRTALDGSADSPNRGHHVEQWSFVVEGSLGGRLHLSPRYYLSLGAHVQFATPYLAIHFVDDQVATSGRPNLLASLTLGAWP